MMSALANHLWQSTLFACFIGLLSFAVQKKSRGGAAWVVAGRVGEVSRSVLRC